MINLDKSDWYLKSDKYPRIIHSNGFYSHQFNVLVLQSTDLLNAKKIDPNITPFHYTNLLGKYIYDSYKGDFPKGMMVSGLTNDKNGEHYFKFWTWFICQYLCAGNSGEQFNMGPNTILSKTFGEPLLHSNFGEGFGREFPKWRNKYTYASYFLKYNNVDIHVGFDNRGSSIEVDDSKSPTVCTEAIKAFIDDIVKNK